MILEKIENLEFWLIEENTQVSIITDVIIGECKECIDAIIGDKVYIIYSDQDWLPRVLESEIVNKTKNSEVIVSKFIKWHELYFDINEAYKKYHRLLMEIMITTEDFFMKIDKHIAKINSVNEFKKNLNNN